MECTGAAAATTSSAAVAPRPSHRRPHRPPRKASPSTTLYNDYELDDPLRLAAIEETRLFFAELLRADLPARNVVDSDFTFLNERLAEHYGIRSVSGVHFRKVTLPPDSLRGGLMTQASVLKVTANGTTTSPVPRGAFVLDRILGKPPAPPPRKKAARRRMRPPQS